MSHGFRQSVVRQPARFIVGPPTTNTSHRHYHNGGRFVENSVRFANTSVESYLERTTVPTGLVDGKAFTVVSSIRWPANGSGGGPRPVFSIGWDDGGYPLSQSVLLEVNGGADGFLNFGTRHGSFSQTKNMQQDFDAAYAEESILTIGWSQNNATLTVTIWYAFHGAEPVKHTNLITGGNQVPTDETLLLGTSAYNDNWVIGQYPNYLATGPGRWNQEMSALYFDDQFIDFSDDQNIARFYYNRGPMEPDTQGNYGFGQPKIFFGRHQKAADWSAGTNLGSGGNFTLVGEAFVDGPVI